MRMANPIAWGAQALPAKVALKDMLAGYSPAFGGPDRARKHASRWTGVSFSGVPGTEWNHCADPDRAQAAPRRWPLLG